jgi:hypothetical protein
MNKLLVSLLVFSLFVLPIVHSDPLWRVGLSQVSTYHYANSGEWYKGTGHMGLEPYTPPEPEIGHFWYTVFEGD